jgi:predicted metal-dependent peptidase
MLSEPFFASLLLQQIPVESKKYKTFAVNGTHLFINPDFADTLTFDETKGVLVHEAMHIALLHFARLGTRNNQRFNAACDYVINFEILKAGFKLPKGALNNPIYGNKSAEDVYRLLEEEEDKNGANNKGNGGNPDQDDNGFGEIIQADSPQKVEEEVKIQIEQALASGKSQGFIPQSLKREIEKNKIARKDWKEILSCFLSEVCNKDYSWMKPNILFTDSEFIMPSLYSKTFGKFILAVDTSASISLQEVSLMVSEALNILETLLEDRDEVELTVIYCDSEVQSVEVLTSSDDTPSPSGGGGTRFSPPFKYVNDNNLECSALIYLTDGEAYDFPDPKTVDFPVIWGLVRDNPSFKPPLGDVFKFDIYS